MKKSLICLLIILISLFVASACKNKETEEGMTPGSIVSSSDKAGESLEPSTVKSLNEEKDNTMIASVNGSAITVSQLDEETETLVQQLRTQVPPEQLDQLKPSMKKQALENLINQKLLFLEADRTGIEVEQKDIDARLAEISNRFPSPDKFQQQLAVMGMTEDDLRQKISESYRIEKVLENQLVKVPEVNEEEVQSFYRDNPDMFRMQEQVQASHILLSVRPDDSLEKRGELRDKLSKIREEIVQGADFAEMAQKHSDCPSKARGGDLGFFEKGKMVKPFEDTAFQLKPGELSEIVETQFGYHLIKVVDHKDAENIPLEQVKDQVENHLKSLKQREVVKSYLNELRNAAEIKYEEGYQP